ncbi:hypothetical protein HDU91_005685 [Kappamyces sp. JEL0680]|nr:hypothetical protein HDU91_005685 [Kappamyces sp. JEL0680]
MDDQDIEVLGQIIKSLSATKPIRKEPPSISAAPREVAEPEFDNDEDIFADAGTDYVLEVRPKTQQKELHAATTNYFGDAPQSVQAPSPDRMEVSIDLQSLIQQAKANPDVKATEPSGDGTESDSDIDPLTKHLRGLEDIDDEAMAHDFTQYYDDSDEEGPKAKPAGASAKKGAKDHAGQNTESQEARPSQKRAAPSGKQGASKKKK